MKSRNYGLDILKNLSMFLIVVLHVLGVGGVLSSLNQGTASYSAAWYLEIISMCSVNCFGMVSGYVLCHGSYRYSRLLSLWISVVFKGIVITLIFLLVLPGSMGKYQWLSATFPITFNVYWYFTGYFALFLFIPYINSMLRSISGKQHGFLVAFIVALFVFAGNFSGNDIFKLHGGYSFLWLMSLYIIGAYLRRLSINPKIPAIYFLISFFVGTLLGLGAFLITGKPTFINYNSPFILLSSVALVLLFRRINVHSPLAEKCINFFVRTSFGVYIIHTQPLIWFNVISERFSFLARLPIPVMLLGVIGCAAAIYLLSTAGEWLSQKALKLIGIALERKFDNQCEKVSKMAKATKQYQ